MDRIRNPGFHLELFKRRALPVVHLLVMKLKIHHSRGSLGSAVWYSPAQNAIAVYYSPHDPVMWAITYNGSSAKISIKNLR